MDTAEREKQLMKRMERLEEMEADILKREHLVKEKETAKKQILLRLAPTLWDNIASWAQDDFRSINSQIEFILSESVKKRKKERE